MTDFIRRALSICAWLVLTLPGGLLHPARELSAQPTDLAGLQRSFERPPDDSKIMVRWWWFGPSVTNAELEREMRLMKEGGIGGFEVQPVYPLALDDPDQGFRNFPFLSDEFIDALRFTASKARELGLRMDLTLGSGWPYGGPHISITQAAGKLRCERVLVPPHSRRIPMPDITTGEKLLAIFLAPGDQKNFAAESAREIPEIRNGAVWLPTDLNGSHVLLFFIASRTGMMVKRAALGAEGFVLDHYDRAAVENHLKFVGERSMEAFGANPPRAIFCDSLEVYGSDWTSNFMEEFQRRRGYDLKPYLPALVGDIGEKTAAIRHDWGATLTELFNERFLIPLHDWARRHGTLLRAQVYGIPPASLSSNRLVDLAEGEGARWKTFTPTRWASSANHLYGQPVTSSETWTWLHSPAFHATPIDMKAEADLHFLKGINQLIGHGWPYSPENAGKPGWRFYAAAVFNQNNPWWPVMPDITLYLQRVSFMLRQGKPVNDVALYLPTDDAWSQFSPGKVSVSEAMVGLLGPNVIPRILEAGYNFDLIDDTVIDQLGNVESGALAVNENRYPIVILPGVERIPVATLRKLDEFARHGGILIATRRTPSLAPGLIGQEEQTRQIREISRKLFEGSSAPAHFIADEDKQLGRTLAGLFPQDVTLSPPEPEIGFVHRRTAFAEIYFLANTGNGGRQTHATFRVEGLQPEWWDPFSGTAYAAQVVARPKGGTTVALDLEPYGSRVLVFSNRTEPREPVVPSSRGIPPALDLSAGWQVSFGENGKPIFMDRLRSWTQDEETRFYSGQATYEKKVVVPESLIQAGLGVRLDFGEGTAVPELSQNKPGMRAWFDGPVREAAVVYLNGQRAGSLWHPPYSVDVTGLLRHGENTFRVVVGNLAINEMAGRALPDYRFLNSRYGVRFTSQDMENLRPLPSGLLGRISLVARELRSALPAE